MPLTDVVPLQLADARSTDAQGDKVYKMVTQFSMKPVEQLGLLKMDFLGLRNLDVIEDALDIIERSSAPGRTWPTCRWTTRRPTRCSPGATRSASSSSSPRACRAPCAGPPDGVRRPRRARGAVPPGRHGPDPDVRARQAQPGRRAVPDERLEPMIGGTYGVILYQEQAMQISKALAGFSGAKADDLRKAIGKKNREAMAALKPEFVAGCQASGTNQTVHRLAVGDEREVRGLLVNKSHAACYALIAYRTAWLQGQLPRRVHGGAHLVRHGHEGQGPVLRRQDGGDGDLDPAALRQRLRPRVRRRDGDIRFGLDAVKGVGLRGGGGDQGRPQGGRSASRTCGTSAPAVDSARVNKKAIEALVKCGAFGSTRAPRKGMLGVLEQAQAAGAKQQQDAQVGQGSIFDLGGDGGGPPAFATSHPPIPSEEFEQNELLAVEKESIGLFISAHPLKQVREALRLAVDAPLSELPGHKDGDWVTAGGIITACKKIRTKKGDPMMFATLDDLEGSIEILVFGKALEAYAGTLEVDEVVLVRGRVDHKDAEKTCVVVQSVEPFAPSQAEVEAAREEIAKVPLGPEPVLLRLDASRLPATVLEELKHLIGEFPGECDVVLEMATRAGRRRLKLGPSYRVTDTTSLRAELASLLGPAIVAATGSAGAGAGAGEPEPRVRGGRGGRGDGRGLGRRRARSGRAPGRAAASRGGVPRPRGSAAAGGNPAPAREPQRAEAAPAHPVQAQGDAEHDGDVADGEDVGQRPAGGDREDVAEEREARVGQRVGVRVGPGRADGQPGGREGVGRRGHDAAVGEDRRAVEQAAERDERDAGHRAVRPRDRAGEHVRQQVDRGVQPLEAVGDHRDDQDLEREGGERQPATPQRQIGQRTQTSAEERDEGDAHEDQNGQ
jgi:DNA polymerase-3 subunit alpha